MSIYISYHPARHTNRASERLSRGREEQRRYREEMRHALRDSQQRVRALQTTRWVLVAIATAIAVVVVGGMMMTVVETWAARKKTAEDILWLLP
jgi:hypothetical protein